MKHPFLSRHAALAGVTLLLAFTPLLTARADVALPRLGEPITYQNLTIFPVRGDAGSKAAVPLTLQEAMDRKLIRVRETGNVNSLEVENLGDKDIFIQAGDIVKGGRQDRVLSVDMVLSVKSGPVPIDAFCVEHGRWSGRGGEKADSFGSSNNALPAKLRLAATPPPVAKPDAPRNVTQPQQKVWAAVQEMQKNLDGKVGAPVASPASPTSMQLTLENAKLKTDGAAYEKAFADLLRQTPDAVGFVVVVNGKVSSSDIYNSQELFQRMWPKLLNAAAIDAISEKKDAAFTPATKETVIAFLGQLAKAPINTLQISPRVTMATRENDKSVASDTLLSDGVILHRSYLAK